MKCLPESLSGGWMIDGMSGPAGLVAYVLWFVIIVYDKHVTNCYIYQPLEKFHKHFFDYFLSIMYGWTTWSFQSMPPTARLYCLINFGFTRKLAGSKIGVNEYLFLEVKTQGAD